MPRATSSFSTRTATTSRSPRRRRLARLAADLTFGAGRAADRPAGRNAWARTRWGRAETAATAVAIFDDRRAARGPGHTIETVRRNARRNDGCNARGAL